MWVRVDDQVPQHPKFLQAGREASWFWVCGNCYCNKYLTDGFIAEHALSALSPGAPYRRLTAKLVEAGLWESVPGGYQVHDYHDHNPRSEQIKTKREQDRLRKRLQAEAKDGVPPPAVAPSEKKPIQLPQNFHAESDATPQDFHGARARAGAGTQARVPSPSPIPSPPVESEHTDGQVQWFAFQEAYPANRREGGFLASQGFVQAVAAIGYPALMARLALWKQTADWQKGMVPRLGNFFQRELWKHDPKVAEDKPAGPSGLELALKLEADRQARKARTGA